MFFFSFLHSVFYERKTFIYAYFNSMPRKVPMSNWSVVVFSLNGPDPEVKDVINFNSVLVIK